jgi:hypothetical protein
VREERKGFERACGRAYVLCPSGARVVFLARRFVRLAKMICSGRIGALASP